MIHNKFRYILTLVALFAMTAGAWAQSTLNVVELEVPATWATDDNPVTAGDLTGFKAVSLEEGQNWKGAPTDGTAVLVYAFDGDKVKYINFVDGIYDGYVSRSLSKKTIFGTSTSIKIYYTAEPTEWSLTPDETGKKWTLAEMPASNIELQVEYEPTKVTMAANDNAMGTLEVAGESKVEWTADTWKGWTSSTKVYTVDDITMTSSQTASIQQYTANCLDFFVDEWEDNSTVTFSTTGDPFTRIEFAMTNDYDPGNGDYHGIPNIQPADGWTFSGKSAVWEGEATKSLTLKSCSTTVSKITFFQGGVPEGVTINTDGTFTVAKTATVTLKATPAEGYKFLYWEDDQTNTNPVREVTIESGLADMTYKAVFAEILYNVTFVEGTNPDPENPEWTATPNPAKTKQTVTVTYTGSKKVIDVTVKKKDAAPAPAPTTTVTWNSSDFYFDENPYTKDGVTLTPSIMGAASGNNLYEYGDNTFTTTLGKFIKIEIVFRDYSSPVIDGWTKETAGQYQPSPEQLPDFWADIYKLTWTGNADSVTLKGKDVYGILSITFTIQ